MNRIQVEESYNWLNDDVMEVARRIIHETDEARLSNVAEHFEIDLSELRKVLEHIRLIRAIKDYQKGPERKKGKWTDTYACSLCGCRPWYAGNIHTLNFCPNCGADMRGDKE